MGVRVAVPRGPASAVVMAVLGATLTYVAVLGWDRSYDRDPVTGNLSGPHEAWQIVGCAAALAVLAFAGGRGRQAWTTVAAVTIAFTVAWSVGAATMTSTGANLWPVGAVLLAAGVFGWGVVFALLGQRRGPEGPGRRLG